jgi:hypothetical protein
MQSILSDKESKTSWALKLLTSLRSSPQGVYMNTTVQFGMRHAKFLDSMIQEQIYPRGLPPPNFVASKEIRDCYHFGFHDFQKIDWI